MQTRPESDSVRSREPFFVVGADRSGTTLLRVMLNAHPILAIPPESHFLAPLLRKIPNRAALNDEQVRAAASIITGCTRFSSWQTTSQELSAELVKLDRPTLSEVVDVVFQLEIGPSGKPRWGDKTPLYASFIDELAELFPNARFIHIVRDGRDVSLSLKSVAWQGWIEYERARYWARIVQEAEDSGARLGATRYVRISYEDLVLNSENVLGRLCDFLEVPVDPGMLLFYENALDHISEPARRAGIHDKVARPPKTTDVGRWRTESTPYRVLLFEAIAGRTMDRMAMERRFDGVGRSLAAVARVFYSPIGVVVSAIHNLFDLLPDTVQVGIRRIHILRWAKRAVVRW